MKKKEKIKNQDEWVREEDRLKYLKNVKKIKEAIKNALDNT
jgi:hypothetical protein